MKAVVQRVTNATLCCNGKLVSEIANGLVVYFGVAQGDSEQKADYLAKKIASLRVFSDEQGKMNLSCLNLKYQILCVSQFTLLADLSHGNRPSFSGAENPQRANEIYEYFCKRLEQEGVEVKRGVFGGDMTISQVNQGPVTVIYEI
ncbi:MAG: D-tyrosyl-tRNA(Tyr) deacylase [Clostridia bacterium]|nr:D-tyrosyl-tRNA(Tyr) deacylase [Clostridia bacterium]